MGKEPSKRVQFEMPMRSYDRLTKLQEMTEATSYAEVVRNALRVYEALIKQTANGGTVLVRLPDGTEAPLSMVQ
jgi:hypothetical protein